jgi:prepilin-type N-terminal cleavage/methylation domain-containing protein
MRKRQSKEKGFTLIEVVVTLLLVGITAALAGMWIVNVANGYVFAKMNADTAQKGQLAMTRLAKEFSSIQSVESDTNFTNDTKIKFTRTDFNNPAGVIVTVSKNGDQLLLNGHPLTDSVNKFELAYCDSADSTDCPTIWSASSRIIEITLTLMGANNTPSSFTGRATPRNL